MGGSLKLPKPENGLLIVTLLMRFFLTLMRQMWPRDLLLMCDFDAFCVRFTFFDL